MAKLSETEKFRQGMYSLAEREKMKTLSMKKIGFLVIIGILAVMGFVAVQAVTEDAAMKDAIKSEADVMTKTAVEGCTMKDMHGCVAECMKSCDKNMADLSAAMVALDEADKAIDAGDSVAAKVEIAKAKTLLNGIQDAQKKCMEKMPVCNMHCPITGKKIDMMNVPASLATMYKGQKIGFCCPACPEAWKKLTDAEKDAKLGAVKFKEIEKETMKKKVDDMIK